jgi:hypothetical protein
MSTLTTLWSRKNGVSIVWHYAQLKIRHHITKEKGKMDAWAAREGAGVGTTGWWLGFRDLDTFKAESYQCFLSQACVKAHYWIAHDGGGLGFWKTLCSSFFSFVFHEDRVPKFTH